MTALKARASKAGQMGKARKPPYLAVREGDCGGRLRGMRTRSRHRAQVVRYVWAEDDGAERPSAFRLILALPVVFEDKLAALADEKGMQVIRLAILLRLSQTLRDVLR